MHVKGTRAVRTIKTEEKERERREADRGDGMKDRYLVFAYHSGDYIAG